MGDVEGGIGEDRVRSNAMTRYVRRRSEHDDDEQAEVDRIHSVANANSEAIEILTK